MELAVVTHTSWDAWAGQPDVVLATALDVLEDAQREAERWHARR